MAERREPMHGQNDMESEAWEQQQTSVAAGYPHHHGNESMESLPNKIIIDFLEGTSKRKDAIAFAKGFIEHHFDSHDSSGWFCSEFEGGFAFEVQEGGSGRAYLPAILETLERDPDVIACVRMARRVLQVKRSIQGGYSSILLPEGLEPPEENIIYVEPRDRLSPYRANGIGIFTTGIGIFSIGIIVFALTLLVYLLNWASDFGARAPVPDPSDLPISQWASLTDNSDPQSFVTALRYNGSSWQFETGQRVATNNRELLPDRIELEDTVEMAALPGVMERIQPTTEATAIEIITSIPKAFGSETADR